jgi:multidrug efflux pump subunit AcrA (membrane-fusion protein)
MAGIVTFGSVFGDALKRAGSRLPEAYLTMRELQERQAQNTRQSEMDEQEKSWRKWQEDRAAAQDKRQTGLDVYNQEQDYLNVMAKKRQDDLSMNEDIAQRETQGRHNTLTLDELIRHDKAMEANAANANKGLPKAPTAPTALSRFTADKDRFTGRMRNILSAASDGSGQPVYDLNSLMGVGANDTTYAKMVPPYRAAEDSLTAAYNQTFGDTTSLPEQIDMSTLSDEELQRIIQGQ